MAHSVLYLFYRYHYPFEVFHQAAFLLWSSLLGCWLPRVYGILSNGLAALHLSCLSYNPVYFGHGHPAQDTFAACPRCITSGLPLSGDIHTSLTGGSFSIYFFSPLNVSLPRLHHHHAFATLHRHFLLTRLPDSTRACIKGGTRRRLSTT